MSEESALFLLLLSGHVLADFLVQKDRIARNKHRASELLQHTVLTWLTHTLLLWPFWTPWLLLGTAALALLHMLVDALKARLGDRGLLTFSVDQCIHLGLLYLTWRVFTSGGPFLRQPPLLTPSSLTTFAQISVVSAAVAFNLRGGARVVRLVLNRFPQVPADESVLAMGRAIGMLERLLVLIMVLLGQWGALGFIVAAKSIARFRQLDQKHFAEYYLIGTLTSLLVAILSGLAVRMVL